LLYKKRFTDSAVTGLISSAWKFFFTCAWEVVADKKTAEKRVNLMRPPTNHVPKAQIVEEHMLTL
jgi:hypothetical protein